MLFPADEIADRPFDFNQIGSAVLLHEMIDRVVDMPHRHPDFGQPHTEQRILIAKMESQIKPYPLKAGSACQKIHTVKIAVRHTAPLLRRPFLHTNTVPITQGGLSRHVPTWIDKTATDNQWQLTDIAADTTCRLSERLYGLPIISDKIVRNRHHIRIQKQQIRIPRLRNQIITETRRTDIPFQHQIAAMRTVGYTAVFILKSDLGRGIVGHHNLVCHTATLGATLHPFHQRPTIRIISRYQNRKHQCLK